MKTKTINLYEYDELTPEAKAKALASWNEHNDNPFMQSHMINLLKEKLDDLKIKYDADSIDVRYSLSHCQGDGFMFMGVLDWKGYNVKIKHAGRYYHSNSKTVDIYDDHTDVLIGDEKLDLQFEKVYQAICKEMERAGYDEIEYQESEENFRQACEANGYTFREDGTMEN